VDRDRGGHIHPVLHAHAGDGALTLKYSEVVANAHDVA
jgi:hypothetical protein